VATGEKIVETFFYPSNEEEKVKKASSGEDIAMEGENEEGGRSQRRKTKFIPELIRYRNDVQDILNSLIKISENNEQAASFKTQEKSAFESI
jgi:hypothetical protein